MRWSVPGALSKDEQGIASALKRVGKFYVFLREVLAELFSDEFQDELEVAYARPRGTAPIPAALLATVTLLQAYDQVSDAEAVVTVRMDQRWQLVLGCVGVKEAPFSQGVLFSFRQRMLEHNLDQKLLDRTVELAKQTGKFGWKQLRVALDSSSLLGAGRVEDTWNLIGRALSLVLDCTAKAMGRTRAEIAAEAKLTLVGRKSLKATLDIDWDDVTEKSTALERLLGEVDSLERWMAEHAGDKVNEAPLQDALVALRQVLAQDLEPDPTTTGHQRIKRGVARDRMPSTVKEHGRSISIHPQEDLLIELRTAKKTKAGREGLRERVTIEHSLARVGHVQGHRSRYRGARKNTLDLRRCAAVVNLQTIDRQRKAA